MSHRGTPAIVRAVWADAHSIDAWTELATLEREAELPIIESVGFLVLDTPSLIGIAASFNAESSTEGGASSIIIIPRRMLLDEVTVLVPAANAEDAS